MKKLLKKIVASSLAFSMAFVSCGFDVFAASSKVEVAEDRIYITSTQYNLVPGATETVVTTNNETGTDQRIGFIMKVDAEALKSGAIKAVATYKDYQYETFGMQTVTDQAAAYEKKHDGETAFAGINADFYNLNTGEVTGTFVMGGTVYKVNKGTPYLAILKDGTAVIRPAGSTDLSDVQDAVSGNMQIITDGVVTVEEGDYQVLKYSRTGIGVTADGDIISYVTHGISKPTSCGETYVDVAKALLAQGCVNAIMLDGGGSATYASKREGTEELVVVNNPSDGTPRTVANALIFVSTLAADGEFDHASLSPNNEYYTPSLENATTTVQFEATGIDASGAITDLPTSGLTWVLAEDSKNFGTIDANTGLFTAANNVVGTVNVNLIYEDKIVGTTSIELVEPDEIYFNSTGVSLNFNDVTDLGLVVKGKGVKLNIKDGDLEWTIKSTVDGVSDDLIGTMNGNIFTSGAKQDFALEGTATVSYARLDGTTLSASIILEVGKMPIVAMDFEDISGVNGKNVVALWDWGASGSYFVEGTAQEYEFQNYDTLYYLQSTTYSSDAQWIYEIYETEQPWVEHDDGTITYTFEGVEYTCTKESTYGEHAQKWISFTDQNGDGYYWRGYIDADTWSGNFNAGGGSASAILGADGYDLYIWHTNANKTNLSSGKLHGEGSQIVDATEGEVRFGEHALKLTYDYRNFSPITGTKNCNTYYRMTNPLVASGTPTGLGMWVYAPEAMDNFWFWTAITYWDGTQWVTAFPHFKPAGAEKTLQYTGINWTGWMYVEADLSGIYAAGAQVDAEHPLQVRSGNALIQMTYIPGGSSDGEGHSIVMGSRTAGHFYIDNVRWVYGTNVDDMNAPEIINVLANSTSLKADSSTSIDSNEITFSVDFTDPQGENYSGIDETATQIYLDGKVLATDKYTATADKLQTVPITLANGEHTLKVSVCDNFGNKTEKTYKIVVANENSEIPTIVIDRNEKAELGGDYKIVIKADSLEDIESISTSISYFGVDNLEGTKTLSNTSFYDDYGNLLTQGSDGLYYDPNGNLVEEPVRPNVAGDYSISNAVQVLGENLTGSIRNKLASANERVFTSTATVNDTLTEDTTLVTFNIPLPSDLTANDKFAYVVTVTYTTTDGNTYTITSGEENAPIYAYYEVISGIHIAGGDNGTLVIETLDGKPVDSTNLQVFVGDTAITGTFEGNVFTTDYFVNLAEKTVLNNVYVGDSVNKHYSFNATVCVDSVAELEDNLHYDLTINATTGDSATTENITWFAHTDAINKAVIEYLTKEDYEAAYKAAYESALAAANGDETLVDVNVVNDTVFANATTVEGSSNLTHFGSDLVAIYVNNVKITGLSEATTYAYRAGDGVNWSTVHEFSTTNDDGTIKFAVVADAQLLGNGGAEDQAAIAVLEKIGAATTDIDFGLQTGDFVDGGITYYQWNQILGVWEDNFVGKDFVHVIGNHETYGTAGSSVSSAIFGLTEDERDYYSVEYGDVYVAVINQTADLVEAAKWLEEDAAKTDCTWKVLSCHQPIYFTNPGGSSDGHHKQLKVACDKAGIDFTFSGHDHAYARTEQMYDGVPVDYNTDSTTNAYVDADGNVVSTKDLGTVYYICGDLGEKSRESGYKIVNNPDFNFAFASQAYDALYLTAEADENKFTVNTWNVTDNGIELFDTFTIYSSKGICSEEGTHVITMDEAIYDPETGMLICERCGEHVDPVAEKYTGFATDVNGVDEYGDSQYYFLAGNVRTGFFSFGEIVWYANEDGLIDHATENWDTNTCTESGRHMAYSPRYDQTFTSTGKVKFTGHDYVEHEDGTLECQTCGHIAIDVADWDFSLNYTAITYNGKARTVAINIVNPETGEKLEFHGDGMGYLTDFKRVWYNNKEVGTATVVVTINPAGDYTNSKGDVTLELQIRPNAPENLTVTNATSTEVTLNWDAVKEATGYKVYRLNTNTGKWNLVGTTTENNFTVTGLNRSTEYTYAVKSYTEVEGEVYNSIAYSDSVTTNTAVGSTVNGWTIALTYSKMTYTGTPRVPKATVTDENGNVLVKGTDYTVKYENNINVGVATVTVTGIGKYEGTLTKTFEVTAQKISEGTLSVVESLPYNGKYQTPTITVTDKNGNVLTSDDYTVEYLNNKDAGTATVVVTGIGNYKGTLTGEFEITKGNIEDATITLSYTSTVFNGANKKPTVKVVTAKGTTLALNKNYTVTYENNRNAGTATVTVTGIGNYEGTQTLQFTITPADITGTTATLKTTEFKFDGTAKEPTVKVVTAKGTTLGLNKNYTVSYVNNVNVGKATAIITGTGNYAGTIELEFDIYGDLADCTAKLKYTKLTYTGKAKKPAVTVTDLLGNTLVKGTDYTVTYENNTNVGTATVTITGIGNYRGEIVKTFTIVPPKATNLEVIKTTDSTIKVGFDRNEIADKYYIYVNGKYVGAALTVDYYTIKGLDSNTTYKITVKAVKVVDGKNVYSISNPSIEATTK